MDEDDTVYYTTEGYKMNGETPRWIVARRQEPEEQDPEFRARLAEVIYDPMARGFGNENVRNRKPNTD